MFINFYFNLFFLFIDQLRCFIGAIIIDPTEETLAKLKKLDLEIVETEEQKDAIHAYHPMGTFGFTEILSFMFAPMRGNFFFF